MPPQNLLTPKSPNESTKTLPSNITITSVTSTTLPAYRRLISTLLPIRYSDQFYKDSVANPTSSSLALCALWHKSSEAGKPKNAVISEPSPTDTAVQPVVVGGIQCRLEPVPTPPTHDSPASKALALYIQTLAVLSPYRSLGIAAALLSTVINTTLTHYSTSAEDITEIYAHVWETNEDALEWYSKRGFVIEKATVEGYYRKLSPSGAKVVRRKIGVRDWLGVKVEEDANVGEDPAVNGHTQSIKTENG